MNEIVPSSESEGEGQRRSARIRRSLLYAAGTAVVAMFCYATTSALPMSEAYWAPMAAIIVLYPERDATVKAVSQRFLGTAIGAVIGGVCAACWHGSLAIYGLGVFLAVVACHLLAIEAAARLCAVAVTVITIVPHSEPPHVVALLRFAEVSYGVTCALAYTFAVDRIGKRHSATCEK